MDASRCLAVCPHQPCGQPETRRDKFNRSVISVIYVTSFIGFFLGKTFSFHEQSLFALPGFIWKLAKIYEKEKPDTVVSFVDHVNIIVALLAAKISRTKPKLLLNAVSHTSIIMKQNFSSRLQGLAIPHLYLEANRVIPYRLSCAAPLLLFFLTILFCLFFSHGLAVR